MHVKDVNKGVRTFFLSAASRFNQANVSNEAIVISYYALLAIIPLMIFIGNLLPLLHLKASTVLAYIEMAIPRSIYAKHSNLLSFNIWKMDHLAAQPRFPVLFQFGQRAVDLMQ